MSITNGWLDNPNKLPITSIHNCKIKLVVKEVKHILYVYKVNCLCKLIYVCIPTTILHKVLIEPGYIVLFTIPYLDIFLFHTILG